RQQLLDALKQRLAVDEGSLIAELTAQPEDGRLKLLLVHRLLQFRRQHPELCARGDYQPLQVEGERAAHVVAFARQHLDEVVVAVASRLVGQLQPEPALSIPESAWQGTVVHLPRTTRGQWRDLLTGRRFEVGTPLALAELTAALPVAALVAE
ncbi:MAG: hypothetical protein ABIJ09_21120, partial [Pseudomonadota bacterium]